jgi:hypothetical protein
MAALSVVCSLDDVFWVDVDFSFLLEDPQAASSAPESIKTAIFFMSRI